MTDSKDSAWTDSGKTERFQNLQSFPELGSSRSHISVSTTVADYE
jgi:hypothetical protein